MRNYLNIPAKPQSSAQPLTTYPSHSPAISALLAVSGCMLCTTANRVVLQRTAKLKLRHLSIVALCLQTLAVPANAEWEATTRLSSYYTDNVGLFSVSRRLSLEEDPTQPVIDEPEKGSDFVYEPQSELMYKGHNRWGEFKLGVDAAAYVFQDWSKYTHSFYEFQFSQSVSEDTELKLFYEYIPDLYLGSKRAFHQQIEEFEADEIVDSHILSLHVDHQLTRDLIVRSLSRFGMRNYNPAFEYRYHHFFTVGAHLEWQPREDIEFMIGYHFERSYADGKQTEGFYDDVSYINHYTSAELKFKLAPQWVLMLIGDFEHNDLLSDYVDDIHHNASENVVQGEIELLYELSEQTTLKAGWQNGYRRFNFEDLAVRNNNLWLGMEYRF